MDAQHKSLILQHGPVGSWCTSAGTADVLGVDDMRFNPDGTGVITTRSLLLGTKAETFEWGMAEPGRLRIRFPAEPGDDEPDYWSTIPFEFRIQRHDVGTQEVMAEVGQSGFWVLVKPLRWVGP